MKSKRTGNRQVTLADIAATAGVTPMTVSRVVNENGYVHVDTREKVLRVVQEMNYRRNGLARGLKRQRTETIGLVIGDVANPFAAEVIRGVREVLTTRGYTLFVCVCEQSVQEEAAAFEALADHRVDGMIVATRASKKGNLHLTRLLEADLPVVALGRDFKHPHTDFVSADHFKGGYDATEHLIRLGHQSIGFIGIKQTYGAGLKRFQGYLKALQAHGVEAKEELIVGPNDGAGQTPGYSTETTGYEGMKRLLALRRRPSAVFARNDFTALGAVSAIKQAGLRIPQDVAIVGFDDVPLAEHTSPPLSTVRQPTRDQGRTAAEFLLRRIEAADSPAREERILPCELVVRESTVTV